MKKPVIIAIFIFTCAVHGFSQSTIPPITGNVNDWENILSASQKTQLDSVISGFYKKTGVPLVFITIGPQVTPPGDKEAFIEKVDSVFHNNRNQLDMAIFLSKEFRTLSIKARVPSDAGDDKMKEMQAKVQQLFQDITKPHVPLLKEGKYAEALTGIITDLSGVVMDNM